MRLRNAILAGVLVASVTALPAAASKAEKNQELVNLHDLKCSVAIGDYFLKQQSLLAVREDLARIGREQNLGKEWNPGNVYWKQAEKQGVLMASRMRRQRELVQAEALAKLEAGVPAPRFELPVLFGTDFRRPEIEALSRAFD